MDPCLFLMSKTLFGMTDAIFIVAIVLLVCLSAFFSASETAFSSVIPHQEHPAYLSDSTVSLMSHRDERFRQQHPRIC